MRPVRVLLLALAVLASCSAERAASSGGVRTVTVSATDAMEFEPAEFEFSVGESVRFEITNVGELEHEFFIGDAAAQEEHAAEMAEMPGMEHGEPTGVTIGPGETATLQYTFDVAGQLFAACHEPGHYEAGMIAEISVS